MNYRNTRRLSQQSQNSSIFSTPSSTFSHTPQSTAPTSRQTSPQLTPQTTTTPPIPSLPHSSLSSSGVGSVTSKVAAAPTSQNVSSSLHRQTSPDYHTIEITHASPTLSPQGITSSAVRRSSSPSNLSVYSDYTPDKNRSYHRNNDNKNDNSNLNRTSVIGRASPSLDKNREITTATSRNVNPNIGVGDDDNRIMDGSISSSSSSNDNKRRDNVENSFAENGNKGASMLQNTQLLSKSESNISNGSSIQKKLGYMMSNINYRGPEAFIQSQFERQRGKINQVYRELDEERKGYVTVGDIARGLKRCGLDPNSNKEVRNMLQNMIQNQEKYEISGINGNINHLKVDFDDFFHLMTDGENVVQRAFTGKLAIPDWEEFCREITEIFESVRPNNTGKQADYIPQLEEQDPDMFGLSICTVDGQRFNFGNFDHDFTIQSCGKVFTYCIACEDNGVEKVHDYVGYEPSGAAFNSFTLDDRNKPHNPMINSGAITVCSLIKPTYSASKRFMYLQSRLSDFAGNTKIGFDNATFLSEKGSADANFAQTYYMKENNVFPNDTKLEETLDFYFQMCSIQVTCEKLANMSATLANAGTCPLTEKKCLSPETVKCVLQLMYSCGMYDFSGEWSCSVGLPSKSGVSGAVCVVIPSVMGFCVFSPRLDKKGNSVRGVDFCMRASKRFKWSIFDQIVVGEDEENEEEQENSQQQDQHQQFQQQKPQQYQYSQQDSSHTDLKRKRIPSQEEEGELDEYDMPATMQKRQKI